MPGQLDILEVLDRQADDVRLRSLYAKSGAVFDTEHCRDGDHLVCTGLVDVIDGGTVSQSAPPSPHIGPCRCSCHD